MDQDRNKRLAEVARIAVKVEAETGVPAQSTVAQWAEESQWGSKPVGHANFFGIKRAARHDQWVTVTTREFFTPAQINNWNHNHPDNHVRPTGLLSPDGTKAEVQIDDQFAEYNSLEASVRDYAWLVSNGKPYAEAWVAYQKNKDVPRFVAGIARVYSTSPDYTSLVNQIAGQANVQQAIAAARSAA